METRPPTEDQGWQDRIRGRIEEAFMVTNHPQPCTIWIREEPRESRLLLFSGLVALAAHLLLLSINLPQRETEPVVRAPAIERPREPMVLREHKFDPPPTVISEPTRTPHTRRQPLPMTDAPPVEPAPESIGEINIDATLTGDGPLILLDDVSPPGAGADDDSAPRFITPEISAPQLIAESRISPDYPSIARFGRAQGRVILQAVILESGDVASIEVISCTQPGYGLEQSAIDAVEQWRYLPATQDGEPVAVYFTIVVQFSLQ